MRTFDSPDEAARQDHWIRGLVATDPFLLLTDASKIFEQADSTMMAIEAAATNLSEIVGKAESLDEFLDTWGETGRSIDAVADDLARVLRENEAEIKPTRRTIPRSSLAGACTSIGLRQKPRVSMTKSGASRSRRPTR